MPRARNLKPSFFKDAKIVGCTFESRLLFQGLWCLADYMGRLKYVPIEIKMEIFPADNVDVESCMNELHEKGLITMYHDHSGATLVQVLGFSKHQNPHVNERQDRNRKPLPCLPSKEECAKMKQGEDQKKAITKQEVEAALVVLREYSESNPADSPFLIPDSLFPLTDSKTATATSAHEEKFADPDFELEDPHRQTVNENHPVWSWMPNQIVMEEISRYRIPVEFISEQLSEFKIYRSGLTENFTNYDSKFMSQVLGSWKRIGQNWKPSPVFSEGNSHDPRYQQNHQQGPGRKLSTIERALLEDAERIRKLDDEIRNAEAQERNDASLGAAYG